MLDILLFGAINYIVNVLSHAFDWFVTQEKISYGIINIFPNLATIGQLTRYPFLYSDLTNVQVMKNILPEQLRDYWQLWY